MVGGRWSVVPAQRNPNSLPTMDGLESGGATGGGGAGTVGQVWKGRRTGEA